VEKRRVFVGWSIDKVPRASSRFEKAHTKSKNKALLKTHIEKEEDTKAQKRGKGTLRVKEQRVFLGRKSFTFSKEQKREKQLSHFFLHRVCESRIKRVLSARSFEEEEERERSAFSSRKKKKIFSRARGWVCCAREREREILCFRGRKKLPYF
jgi:hypothetical protein